MDILELDDRISAVCSWIKREPGNIEARLQLVKLYCFQAEWDRALLQLDTLLKIDPETQRQVELYKNLIFSERLRDSVLSGGHEACLLEGTLPDWVQELQRANAFYAVGQEERGKACRLQALENAPMSAGHSETLGEFTWLADGDDRLGPICEFICAGGYRWVPFSGINALVVNTPKGLTDLVWASATLMLDKPVHGFIPARYPLMAQKDHKFKTGSQTQWQQQGQERYVGHGRKMWMSSAGECALFEAGNITFNRVKSEHEA
ncbi:type VI secretion system accessory protein TagJ [Serratia inhibens]|uniref:type VI secretion system accessory protein TagJ n=1 Tax=Serratia inhibens TaxID=2338073 RepID=UPI0003016A41|nr:type VI secretion system accessory protein TagJ [Serratia inhibens]